MEIIFVISKELLDILQPIKRHTIADGYIDVLVNLEKSHGLYLHDDLHDQKYLDFFSFYASQPLGYNHPSMLEDEGFLRDLKTSAINKISNSDFYTRQSAEFVDTFASIAAPHGFENYFFIEGGALAVENTLKTSFDWKVRKNLAKGNTEVGSQVIHFKQAFHGRSGYTMSLTNTADPRKYKYFPTFKWPRVTNPKIVFPIEEHIEEVKLTEQQSISEINSAIEKAGDDIAALIIEPIQGEGGDNHFREEFLNELRTITLENEIMLIYDEIQTGIALTGKMWAFEHYPDAKPDLVAFGKKTQVCGFMSTDRVKEVENNVFEESSRINSTWGGNLVDMVRSTKILDIIKEDSIVSQVNTSGEYLMKLLYEFQETFDHLTNVRGRGLFAAFDLPTTEIRNQFKKDLFTNGLIMLPSGVSSIRFRPPLITTPEHIDEAGTILEKSLKSI